VAFIDTMRLAITRAATDPANAEIQSREVLAAAHPARAYLGLDGRDAWPPNSRQVARARRRGDGGTSSRNILWIVSLFITATKTRPISAAMDKSRDIASRASISIAAEGSGISVVRSLPWYRIVIANSAKGTARAAGCDTSFCSGTCAMPIEHGVKIVRPLTSAVWRPEPLIGRKLIPSLEHVTWRDPTVTPTRLAISSRLIPTATKPLICSITCGVNLMRRPLARGLAFVIVMATPLEVVEATSAVCTCSASFFITWFAFLPIAKATKEKGRLRL